MQNITLALPLKILRQIKRAAARRHLSVSQLVMQTLEDLAAREEGYAQARVRYLAYLDKGADLGTHGVLQTDRNGLHER